MTKNSSMRPISNLWPKLATVLLIVTLTACSAVRLGYANGESLVYWWMNGYVNFDDDQKFIVKQQIANYLSWHRQTQLKDYAQLLVSFQQRIQGAAQQPVTSNDVVADYSAIRKRVQTAVERSLPDLAALALTLHPKQLEHLERKFAANNADYRKDYLRGDPEERQAFRFKKVMDQAEYWFGDFSREQEKQIRAVVQSTPLNNEIWLAERQERQGEMLRMLRKIQAEKPSQDAALDMLRSYAERGFDIFTYERHPQFFDASREGVAKIAAAIINVATPKQRAHAVKRLQQWIDDCHALAAK